MSEQTLFWADVHLVSLKQPTRRMTAVLAPIFFFVIVIIVWVIIIAVAVVIFYFFFVVGRDFMVIFVEKPYSGASRNPSVARVLAVPVRNVRGSLTRTSSLTMRTSTFTESRSSVHVFLLPSCKSVTSEGSTP